MRTYKAGRRRSWQSIVAAVGAVLAMGVAASACALGPAAGEPVATSTDATPVETIGETDDGTGQPPPGPSTVAPQPPPPPPPPPGPTGVVQPTPANQIIVKINTPPSVTNPCFPAGSIEVYGSAFPVTVTHEWRRRSVGATGNGVLLGPAVTHGYNVAGGKAISSQKLPAGNWQVQLRVTSPRLITSQWVTHNPCAG